MDKNQRIELLAPAKNLQIAKSAIIYGADAVYIGAESFGARKSASNSIDDIKELVEFAHKFNVKVYVTLNTILNDKELFSALKMVEKLYEINVDALIIQDLGLLELDLPSIDLHLSTQCNIRTLEKVKFFENLNLKRVVLARELSLKQIEEISKNTNLELECFIHGALCVSYSGNCYLSAFLGGRSANRGECAQACRRKYTLLNEKGKIIEENKYLLSMKDFSAVPYLDKLVQSGVKSFKIEGRLKDENYVKNVVLYYRRLLDRYEKTSIGNIISDFKPDINKTFNRGYTTYFLSKEEKNCTLLTPKSTGEKIGEVVSFFKDGFIIKTDKEINVQDGLCFFSNNELKGFLVNKVEGNKIYPNKRIIIKKGDKIFRNQNVKFEKILSDSKTKRLIDITIEIYEDKIKAIWDDSSIQVKLGKNEIAKDKLKMRENFINCFKKTDGSIFFARNIIFKTENIPFLSLSSINKLRREIYLEMEKTRLLEYKKEERNKIKYTKYKESNIDYRLNIYNKKALEFYKKCSVEPVEYALEKTLDFKNKELMRTKYCIRKELNMCLKSGIKNEKLYLIDESKRKFLLNFDCKNCEMSLVCAE